MRAAQNGAHLFLCSVGLTGGHSTPYHQIPASTGTATGPAFGSAAAPSRSPLRASPGSRYPVATFQFQRVALQRPLHSPRTHGGSSEGDNLALCCLPCCPVPLDDAPLGPGTRGYAGDRLYRAGLCLDPDKLKPIWNPPDVSSWQLRRGLWLSHRACRVRV